MRTASPFGRDCMHGLKMAAMARSELRCVLAIIRHGDRTPKQKMKMTVTQVCSPHQHACTPSGFSSAQQQKGPDSGREGAALL